MPNTHQANTYVAPSQQTHTLALGIEFNGSNYRGWQRQQAGVASVQQTLEEAISQVANEPVSLHAAGRTDAGVHASNMVAHFSTMAFRENHGWIRGINTLVNNDIAVRWLRPVSADFHARFKANARRYRYVLLNQAYRPALLHKQVTFVHEKLDVSLMQAAVAKLVGTHDFSSFRAAACQSNQPVRHVQHAQFVQQGGLIYLDIKADGFLHHMVRNIMGTCLAIAQKQEPVSWIEHLLAVKDRSQAGITAAPDGLYFVNAYYPDVFQRQLPSITAGPVWLNPEGVATHSKCLL